MSEKEVLLQQLSDIQALAPVGFWPPAPGWIALILIVLVCLGLAVFLTYNYVRKTRYRRQALAILKGISKANEAQQQLTQTQALLKRTLLTAYKHSRNEIAGLYGEQLFMLLQATQGNTQTKLNSQWHLALYQSDATELPIDDYLRYAKQWIKHHKSINKTAFTNLLATSVLREPAHG